MKNFTINSTSEALSFLYSLSLNYSSFKFRGQVDFSWTLQPTIYRFNNFERYQTVQYEKFLLQNKPKNPMPPLIHTNFDLEWLMLCQHYGIPTRLLDWTSDILIALFFACYTEDINETDGALFICNQDEYPKFNSYTESAMDNQSLSFIETYLSNPRMRMQSGCFMMWGHAPIHENSTNSYDLWEYNKKKNNKDNLKKICIPKNKKQAILRELKKVYSITKNSIYLQNSYLDKTYSQLFMKLKENAKIMTLYTTNADSLSPKEEKKAKAMFSIECRNMIGNCYNIRKVE